MIKQIKPVLINKCTTLPLLYSVQDVYEFQLHVHNAQNKIPVNLISQMLSFSLEYQAYDFLFY